MKVFGVRRLRGVASSIAAAAVVIGTMAAVPAAGEVVEDEVAGSSEQIELSGVLRVVPAELRPIHVEVGQPAPEPEVLDEGSVALLTDSGAIVELSDVDAAGLSSGQRYTATVDVPADVQDAVDEAVEDPGALDQSATADAVAEAAATEQIALPVVQGAAEPVTAEAVPAMAHTVDVIFYRKASDPAAPTGASIDGAISRMSEYWASESAGQVSSITRPSAIKFQTVTWDICNQYTAWTNAAAAFGTAQQTYWASNTRRHLVVIVPDTCGGGGLGTIGSAIHTGGMIHAEVTVARPIDWDQVLLHEFGHNITLNHSDARTCTSPIVDSARNTTTGNPANTACNDVEYMDLFDVMGLGYTVYSGSNVATATTRNITTLNSTHKAQLGALTTSNGLTNVTTSGGYVQTFTLQASSATSGVRALGVTDTNGEKVYVEYRAGTGRDANAMYKQWTGVMANNAYAPGVRVLRHYGNISDSVRGSSVALQRHTGTTPARVMQNIAGQQLTTHTSNVTVRVVSMTATTATVEIGYYRPYTTTPTATIAVTGGGTAYVGKTLTVAGATATAWEPDATSLKYQWLRAGVAITGATASSYQVQGADKAKAITVRVTPVLANWRNLPVTSAAVTPNGPTVERTAGTSRFDTAVEVSKKAFTTTAPVVYVATGMDYPDALGAAPAAAFKGGPLLLVPSKGTVPATVVAEVARLKPSRIVVVGGAGVVPDAVAAQVKSGWPSATLDRLSGNGRYDTARSIVADAFTTSANVYIATGRNYPDALSASALAGAKDAPVVLVDGAKATLDAPTVALLASLKPSGAMKAWVIGGEGAVSAGIQSQLSSLGYTPQRLAGANRYDTSVEINKQFTGATVPQVYFATGTGFADALAGAVWAGVKGAPLYVGPPTCVTKTVAAQLGAKTTTAVGLIGGEGALNANVFALGICP